MAKDKKDKALKVPKRIAGVKVPKKVRKTANSALALAESPHARELAIAALTAAAAALGKKGSDAVQESGAESPREVKAQAGRLSDMVIAAALEGARRLLDGIKTQTAAAAPADEPEAADEPSPPKKKRSRASASRARAAPARAAEEPSTAP